MNTKLRNALSDEQMKRLYDVCQDFSNYTLNRAFKELWKMTYAPKEALEQNGLDDPEYLRYYKKVRNEISDFVGVYQVLPGTREETKELFVALKQDRFALKRITELINDSMLSYPIEELERINGLLNNTRENMCFGGLRSLKLFSEEAKFFLPYVKNIAKYFTQEFETLKKNINVTSNKVDRSKPSDDVNINVDEETTHEEKKLDNDKEMAVNIVSKLFENKERVLNIIDKSIKLDEAINNNKPFDIGALSNIMGNMDLFIKMTEFVMLWEDISKVFSLDADTILRSSIVIKEAATVIEDAKKLESLDIDIMWLLKNDLMIKNLLNGEFFNS